MDVYYENEKFISNGITYPFRSHKQECTGYQVMIEAHYHVFIEILFCKRGCFNIILDGKRYFFSEGDMVIINSMEVHHVIGASDGVNEYIVVRFGPELLYTTAQTIFEAKYVLPFTLKTSTHQKLFSQEEIQGTFIPALIESIILEDSEKKYGFELAIRTYIGQLFLWILRCWNQKGLDLNLGYAFNQLTIERLQKVFDYVDQHYDQVITIDDVAKLCNMSYSYFSRFFKHVMQQNFCNYVNCVRASKAENLLTSTDLSITEIALNVGFSTTSYFIEQFKIYKDMTPNHFRHNFITLGNQTKYNQFLDIPVTQS